MKPKMYTLVNASSNTFRICNIKSQNIEIRFTPNIPAQCLNKPEILFLFALWEKSEISPFILRYDFIKLQTLYKDFTDRSEIIGIGRGKIKRIPDSSLISIAEAKAVDLDSRVYNNL